MNSDVRMFARISPAERLPEVRWATAASCVPEAAFGAFLGTRDFVLLQRARPIEKSGPYEHHQPL
jgi:hypothetical protein